MAHLTCVGHSRRRAAAGRRRRTPTPGVRNVLALRGDPPGGPRRDVGAAPRAASRYADELVELVKSLGDFCVGVAAFPDGHPRVARPRRRRPRARGQGRAGADFAITQFFFDADDYLRLRRPGRGARLRPADHPRDHAGDERRADRAVRRSCRARRSRPSSPTRLDAVADDPEAVRARRRRGRDRAVRRGCSPGARRACTSTR